MTDFEFCDSYWVLEFDHLQTGLFVDDETSKEIVQAKKNSITVLWITDSYGVDFLLDPTKLFLAHKSTPETRLHYRLHNEAIDLEKKQLGPWSDDEG